MHFLKTTFIDNGTLIIWCLLLGGQAIKFAFPKLNKKWIPLINIIVGILFMVFWVPAIHLHIPIPIRINRGIVYGFASIGLHQLISIIIYVAKVKYYSHPSRDRRKIRKINI